jgi:hypothetical protein
MFSVINSNKMSLFFILNFLSVLWLLSRNFFQDFLLKKIFGQWIEKNPSYLFKLVFWDHLVSSRPISRLTNLMKESFVIYLFLWWIRWKIYFQFNNKIVV